MGTNYYLRVDQCGACGRYDDLHICKSLINFDTIRSWEDDTFDQRIDVGSWAEWKVVLRTARRAVVRDEYGTEYAVEEFIRRVETPSPGRTPEEEMAGRRWQYDWIAKHHPDEISDGPAVDKTWLDPEGFTFSGRGFS